MLRTLDHVVIAVRDLAAASRSYVSLLGRRPSWIGTHPEQGTSNHLFQLENTYVELLSASGDGSGARMVSAAIERDGEGLFALAFGTDDASACAEALRASGLAVDGPHEGEGVESRGGGKRSWRSVWISPTGTRGARLFAIEHRPPASLGPGEGTRPAEACVAALDHVVVTTSDPDASRELYGGRLGLRLALDRTFPERGVRLLFFRVGGVTLELAARAGGVPNGGGPDRPWGLAYRVPDVSAARERLRESGVPVSTVRPGHKEGTRVCTVSGETHGVATLLIGPDVARP